MQARAGHALCPDNDSGNRAAESCQGIDVAAAAWLDSEGHPYRQPDRLLFQTCLCDSTQGVLFGGDADRLGRGMKGLELHPSFGGTTGLVRGVQARLCRDAQESEAALRRYEFERLAGRHEACRLPHLLQIKPHSIYTRGAHCSGAGAMLTGSGRAIRGLGCMARLVLGRAKASAWGCRGRSWEKLP